jgi:hypothetical protein
MEPLHQRVEVSCRSCGARILFEPLQRTTRCPYCDSPSVVDRPVTEDRPDPVFGFGFVLSRDEAARRMRRWIRGRRMAPFGLKDRSAENVKGVYLPAYLYSATAHTGYAASIGESYRDRDKKRRTEYHQLAGKHSTYVADVLVTASRGIPNDEIEGIEPFDLGSLARYTPGLVSGWISEEPSLSREECRRLGRQEATARIDGMLRRFLPGDTVRDLRRHVELVDESIDLTLVPLWVFAIRYHDEKPPIRVLVNGQTGKVFGKVPVSWAKIGLIALGLLALVGLVRLIVWWLQ